MMTAENLKTYESIRGLLFTDLQWIILPLGHKPFDKEINSIQNQDNWSFEGL